MKPLLITMAILVAVLLCVLLVAALLDQALAENTTAPQTTQAPDTLTHEHTFGDWQVIRESTCTEDGASVRFCKLCSFEEQTTIPSPGHSWQKATCEYPKTCKKCKVTEGEPLEHNIVDGICTLCQTSFRTDDAIKNYLKIVDVALSTSAEGGVNVQIGWENLSDKTIRYIHFDVTALNADGEEVPCEKSGQSSATLSDAGPFDPSERVYTINTYGNYDHGLSQWEDVWFSDAVASLRIDRIHLLFEDNTRTEFSTAEVEHAHGSMTLSTTVSQIESGTLYFQLENSADDGVLFQEDEELLLKLISDEGYHIRKYGSLSLTLTDTFGNQVLLEKTYSITAADYDALNRLKLILPIVLHQDLVTPIRVDILFEVDGEADPYIFSQEGVLHARS